MSEDAVLDTANENKDLNELSFANNVLAVPITFHRVDPDLQPIALVVPNTLSAGTRPMVTLAWGVTNSSPIKAMQGWLGAVYLSRSPTRDGTEQRVDGYFSDSLPGWDNFWVTNRVQLPIAESGRYYLILIVTSEDRICESSLSNNSLTKEIWITIQPPAQSPPCDSGMTPGYKDRNSIVRYRA